MFRLLVTVGFIPNVEQAFSGLKIIKKRLGSTMDDAFLATRMLVSMEGKTAAHHNYEHIKLYNRVRMDIRKPIMRGSSLSSLAHSTNRPALR